jgi:hypothetical protein
MRLDTGTGDLTIDERRFDPSKGGLCFLQEPRENPTVLPWI